VVHLRLPPLRKRREEIEPLVRATAVCDGQTIHVEDLPPEIVGASPEPPPDKAAAASGALPAGATASGALESPSAAEIVAAIRAARGRRGAAAAAHGISRTTLWRRLRELGLG
jgi:transcriptional regulator of acetoin/glycerol metabolism